LVETAGFQDFEVVAAEAGLVFGFVEGDAEGLAPVEEDLADLAVEVAGEYVGGCGLGGAVGFGTAGAVCRLVEARDQRVGVQPEVQGIGAQEAARLGAGGQGGEVARFDGCQVAGADVRDSGDLLDGEVPRLPGFPQFVTDACRHGQILTVKGDCRSRWQEGRKKNLPANPAGFGVRLGWRARQASSAGDAPSLPEVPASIPSALSPVSSAPLSSTSPISSSSVSTNS
jgi:hypothetical protein